MNPCQRCGKPYSRNIAQNHSGFSFVEGLPTLRLCDACGRELNRASDRSATFDAWLKEAKRQAREKRATMKEVEVNR